MFFSNESTTITIPESSAMAGRSKVVMAVVSLEDAMASANALKATALLKPDQHVETKICVRETARMYESVAVSKTNNDLLRTTRKTGVDAPSVIETNAKFSVSDLRMRFEGVQGPLVVRENESKRTTLKLLSSRSRYDVYGVSVYEENDTEDEVNVNEQDVSEVVEEDVVAEEEICPTPPQLIEKSSTTNVEKDSVPSEYSTSAEEEVVPLYETKTVVAVPTAEFAHVPVPVPTRTILPPMTMASMLMLMVFLHFMIRVIVKVGLKTALWMISTMWWLVVSMGWWTIGSLAPEVVAGGLGIGVVIRVMTDVSFGALTALTAIVQVFKILFTVNMTMTVCLVAGLKWCTRTGFFLMTTMATGLSAGWSLTSYGVMEGWHGLFEGGRRTKLWVVGTWASMKAIMMLELWLWLEVAYVAMWFCWFVMAQIVRFDCTKVEKTKVSMMVQEVQMGSSTSAVLVEKKKSDNLKEDKSIDVETDSDTQTDSETETETGSMSESEASSNPLNETETEPMEPTMDKVKMDFDRLTHPWTHAITMDMTAETNEVYKVQDEVVVEWCPLPPSDQHAALGRGSIDTVGCDRTVSVGGVVVVVDGVEVTCVGETTGFGSGCGSLKLVDLHELHNEVHGPTRVDMEAFSSLSPVVSSSSSSSSSSSVSSLAPSSSQELSVLTTVEAAVEFDLTVEVETASRSAFETEVNLTEVDASHEVAPRVPVVTSATTEPVSEREREPVTLTTSVDTSASSQSIRGRTTKRKPKKEVTSLYLLYKTHSKSYQRNVEGSLAKRKALESTKDRVQDLGGCRRRNESV